MGKGRFFKSLVNEEVMGEEIIATNEKAYYVASQLDTGYAVHRYSLGRGSVLGSAKGFTHPTKFEGLFRSSIDSTTLTAKVAYHIDLQLKPNEVLKLKKKSRSILTSFSSKLCS
jgi:hypothetical protein